MRKGPLLGYMLAVALAIALIAASLSLTGRQIGGADFAFPAASSLNQYLGGTGLNLDAVTPVNSSGGPVAPGGWAEASQSASYSGSGGEMLLIREYRLNGSAQALALYSYVLQQTVSSIQKLVARGPLYNLTVETNLTAGRGVYSVFSMSSLIVPRFGPAVLLHVMEFVVLIYVSDLPVSAAELGALALPISEQISR